MPSPSVSSLSASTTSAPLRRLLDETSDFIDSPIFTHVLTLLLDAAFSHLIDRKVRAEAYKLAPVTPTPTPEFRVSEVIDPDPLTASTKLATILAVMAREAHKIGNGVPNEYVQAIEAVSELEAFAAVVYSSNLELEAESRMPETIVRPDSTIVEGRDEMVADSEDRENGKGAKVRRRGRIINSASGVVDFAWGGFESIWSKVTGND